MKREFIQVIMMLAGVVIVSIGRAEIITYSTAIPRQPLTGDDQIKSWYRPVSVPQFDPVLGQLQSIRFDLSVMASGNFGIENPSGTSLQATGGLSVLIRWSSPNLEHLVETRAHV